MDLPWAEHNIYIYIYHKRKDECVRKDRTQWTEWAHIAYSESPGRCRFSCFATFLLVFYSTSPFAPASCSMLLNTKHRAEEIPFRARCLCSPLVEISFAHIAVGWWALFCVPEMERVR